MSYVANTTTIPDVQTAEELLRWMIDNFQHMKNHNGIIMLDQEDIADLLSACESFKKKCTRSEGQPTTEPLEKEGD